MKKVLLLSFIMLPDENEAQIYPLKFNQKTFAEIY